MNNIVFEGKTPDGIPYIIRYPKDTDLTSMWRYINELSKEQTYISFQGEEISPEEEKEFLNSSLKNISEKKGLMLIVELKGEIVGVSDVRPQPRVSSHVGVFGISLAKEVRGKGIGKKLMQLALDVASRDLKGLRILELECFGNNPVAPQLYKSLGFKEYGVLPGGIAHKGKFVDCIYMYYEIPS